jgi:hypothetical protein
MKKYRLKSGPHIYQLTLLRQGDTLELSDAQAQDMESSGIVLEAVEQPKPRTRKAKQVDQ